LNQAVDIWSFPFEVTFRVIGWSDIGVEEELAGVGVRPVFGDGKLSLTGLAGFNEFFEGAVFADELEGCGWADFGYWVKVIAAKENAEVDEL